MRVARPPTLTDLAVGQHWAYRASWRDPLVEVAVVRLGVKAPARVLVRWVSDEFEGKQDWVPPARLKVSWADLEAFRANERRWDEVLAQADQYPEIVSTAASVVFDLLIDQAHASLGYNAEDGVLRVHDAPALAGSLGIESKALETPVSFGDDGDLVSPMAVAVAIARRAAELQPDAILRYVEREEADGRSEAVHGRFYPGGGPRGGWEVPPEVCRQVDDERGKPVRALLRDWVGAEAVETRADVTAARDEAARLAKLADAALTALRQAGHVTTANRIERDLGPVRGPSVPKEA